MAKTMLKVPLNRVEGDLEIRVEIEDGVVRDAWCTGTMFRGFESLMVGRGALDGLVITPRICGLCSTTHLTAAARALDMISGMEIPDNARRIRNIVLMAENIQSDIRQAFLMYLTDFANPTYSAEPFYDEVMKRYAPLKGKTAVEVIIETKRLLEIVALMGGQWPHSSFIVPGGVVSLPSAADVIQCRNILAGFKKWYEDRVLGCSMARWSEVKTVKDFEAWMTESPAHRASEIGFFYYLSRKSSLHKTGEGHGNYISFGSLDMPAETEVQAEGGMLVPAGFANWTEVSGFDQTLIQEHVAHSWFIDYEGGRHPSQGETKPYASGYEGKKYSWAKAPRYAGKPAETGPMAEMVIGKHPLITDFMLKEGPNSFLREFSRIIRPATLIPAMETWMLEISRATGNAYNAPGFIKEGEGIGMLQAARGALGHWVSIKNGRIERYQVITPTAWHASPRDSEGNRGPFEEALIGVSIKDPDNPVELGHIIRSFDPCMVCTVHTIDSGIDRRFRVS